MQPAASDPIARRALGSRAAAAAQKSAAAELAKLAESSPRRAANTTSARAEPAGLDPGSDSVHSNGLHRYGLYRYGLDYVVMARPAWIQALTRWNANDHAHVIARVYACAYLASAHMPMLISCARVRAHARTHAAMQGCVHMFIHRVFEQAPIPFLQQMSRARWAWD